MKYYEEGGFALGIMMILIISVLGAPIHSQAKSSKYCDMINDVGIDATLGVHGNVAIASASASENTLMTSKLTSAYGTAGQKIKTTSSYSRGYQSNILIERKLEDNECRK